MGYFNVLKGAYPSLQQIDKTLTVNGSGIVRGSLIYEASGKFNLAGVAQATDAEAYIYFSLNDQTGLVEGAAGTIGMGTGRAFNGNHSSPGVTTAAAVVTGIAVGQPIEFETDQYAGTPAVGDMLTSGANGKLTAWAEGSNVIAQVTKAAASKWVNNAIAVTGFRTGANVSVLTARTLWIPLFSAVDAT